MSGALSFTPEEFLAVGQALARAQTLEDAAQVIAATMLESWRRAGITTVQELMLASLPTPTDERPC